MIALLAFDNEIFVFMCLYVFIYLFIYYDDRNKIFFFFCNTL